jgi:recombination associated protein RdgC
MWFSSAKITEYKFDKAVDIEPSLAEASLKPCPPHARFIYGWLPVSEGCYAQEVAGVTLICMGKEERILPRSVINRELEERVEAEEARLQRDLKRSEKKQMAEEIEFELLPKAFCLQKRTFAILDSVSNHLIINTSSQTQAEQFTSFLRKSIPDIHIEPLQYGENLAARFSEWITHPSSIPASFQLASDCLLFSPDNEKKKFSCKGYELPADEVLSLLTQGLSTAEISVQWNERIQLTLTQDFTLKRIKCLDYLVEEFSDLKQEEEDQQRDAALVLLAGELRSMINDLLKHLMKKENQMGKNVERSEALLEA